VLKGVACRLAHVYVQMGLSGLPRVDYLNVYSWDLAKPEGDDSGWHGVHERALALEATFGRHVRARDTVRGRAVQLERLLGNAFARRLYIVFGGRRHATLCVHGNVYGSVRMHVDAHVNNTIKVTLGKGDFALIKRFRGNEPVRYTMKHTSCCRPSVDVDIL
jgi:hypothetical protein